MDFKIGLVPAVEVAELIRTKKISPVEYMRGLLARIDALEPKINAFAYLAADRAMDEAKRAEEAMMRGERIGRLHGVPATLKDLLITKDMPTQYGSKIFAGHQPTEESPIVSRLREEGAIILGKTTTSEFGTGSPGVSRSPLTGITSNPWKLGYNAGASSSGAAAAAAAGFGPLHHGGDGGGSIRLPAHFCGVFGVKPSFGRVPYYPVSTGDLIVQTTCRTHRSSSFGRELPSLSRCSASLTLGTVSGMHSIRGCDADRTSTLRRSSFCVASVLHGSKDGDHLARPKQLLLQ